MRLIPGLHRTGLDTWHNGVSDVSPTPACENRRPFQRVEAGVKQLSVRHASEVGPQQLVRDALKEDSQESELRLSAQAPGNRLACCRVHGVHREVAAAAPQGAKQTGDGAAGHLASGAERDHADADGGSAHESCQDLLLLARPSGSIGEHLQVYVLQGSSPREPAVKLEVNTLLPRVAASCSTPDTSHLLRRYSCIVHAA